MMRFRRERIILYCFAEDGMKLNYPQSNAIFFGFDSAWTDNPRNPGAICSISFSRQGVVNFDEPRLVSFDQAAAYIETAADGFAYSLVAVDQPTVVPNQTGSRPVDKVSGSLVSFVGGGVQPANRGKQGMFCDASPIWRFLAALDYPQRPLEARAATAGHYLIEVFPALALPALNASFAYRLSAPKYNPQNRKKFRLEHWASVATTIASTAEALGVGGLRDWAMDMALLAAPKKADQDRLDAALCALIGLIWRAGPRDAAGCIGDMGAGYMVTVLSDATRHRLQIAACKRGVPFS
jgi:predicted RNase H-like nuclease